MPTMWLSDSQSTPILSIRTVGFDRRRGFLPNAFRQREANTINVLEVGVAFCSGGGYDCPTHRSRSKMGRFL